VRLALSASDDHPPRLPEQKEDEEPAEADILQRKSI
jgi:hypothetical protein